MKRKYLILFSLSGLILSLDQLTKHLIQESFKLGEGISIISGLLDLSHERNSGFVFGFLQKAPASLQDVFFIGIPVFALILIILIFIKLQDDQMLTSVALTTILGGAIGNLIDRIKYGYVVDFIGVHFGEGLRVPPFNIADCSIVVGVGIMFLNTLIQVKVKE